MAVRWLWASSIGLAHTCPAVSSGVVLGIMLKPLKTSVWNLWAIFLCVVWETVLKTILSILCHRLSIWKTLLLIHRTVLLIMALHVLIKTKKQLANAGQTANPSYCLVWKSNCRRMGVLCKPPASRCSSQGVWWCCFCQCLEIEEEPEGLCICWCRCMLWFQMTSSGV